MRPLSFRDVTSNAREADGFAGRILNRGNTQRYIHSFPGFGHTNRFQLVDAATGPQRFKNLVLLIWSLRRDDDRNWLSDDLILGVLEHALGTWVPSYDDAVQSYR